jgi:hypothetical protein
MASLMRTIVLITQGSSQSLTGLAVLIGVLKSRRINPNEVELTVVSGGACAGTNSGLHAIFGRMFSFVFPRTRVIAFDSVEDSLEDSLLSGGEPVGIFRNFLEMNKIGKADTLFFSRNMQLVNELFLSFMDSDEKICFGDIWAFDNNATHFTQPVFGRSFPDFNLCASYLPVEFNARGFSGKDILSIDPSEFRQAVNVFRVSLPRELEISRIDAHAAEINTLVTTSNLVECRVFRNSAEEVEFYYQCLKKYLNSNFYFIIKGHPREQNNQAELLKRRIEAAGFRVAVISRGNVTPVEVLIEDLKIKQIIPILSSCVVNVKMLNQDIKILGSADEIASNLKMSSSKYYIFFNLSVCNLLVGRIQNQNYAPISHEELCAAAWEEASSAFTSKDNLFAGGLLKDLKRISRNDNVKYLAANIRSRQETWENIIDFLYSSFMIVSFKVLRSYLGECFIKIWKRSKSIFGAKINA